MKRTIALLLALVVMVGIISYVPVTAQAAEVNSGKCGENLTWTLDEAGVLTISGSGAMDNYNSGGAPWYDYRDAITKVIICDGVTSIGERAFYQCEKMVNIEIPNSVTAIGESAFYFCYALETITLPDGLTSIAYNTFSDCASLTEIVIPDGVTEIGLNAFYRCYELESVILPESLLSFDGAPFYACKKLTEITIPTNVTTLGFRMFPYCNSLSKITFLGNAPSFESNTFDGVTATVYYPGGNATWTTDVLQNYGGTITWVPYATETIIASGTCGENLTWKLDENGLLTISGEGKMKAFAGVVVTPWYQWRKEIKNIVIKDGVTNIASYAFEGCVNLESIIIPQGIISIGVFAFSSCHKLASLSLPQTVTSIGIRAFSDCDTLQSVTIPKNVASIGKFAFLDCDKLRSIWVDPENPNFCNDDNGILFNKNMTTLIVAPQSIAGEYAVPDTVVRIEEYAFYFCKNLTNLIIPKSVSEFASTSCIGCGQLIGIWVDPDNRSLCNDDRGVLFDKSKTTLIKAPDTITGEYSIPDTVTDIDERAFFSCDLLTSVSIPHGVTEIPDHAFFNCRKLRIVVLANTITYIDDHAFYWCSSLKSITIPASVTEIGTYAFSGSGLSEITFLGNAPKISDTAFNNKTITAYYLADNKTWTEEVMQNYGGTITWVPYCAKGHDFADGYCTNCGAVQSDIFIAQQPTNAGAALGENYCVTVEVEGEGLKYQWYFRNAGSSIWYKSSIRDNTYDDVMTTARAGREVYCVITDAYGNKVTTDIVKLIRIAKEELQIVTQPVSDEAALGDNYSVTVVAKGEGLKYQWYFRNEGSLIWYKSSVKTDTYSNVMTKARAGREIFCVITDALGNTVTTDIVKLIRVPKEELQILIQPTNAQAALGSNYCVAVVAQGEGLKYQWYFRNAGTDTWYKSSVRDNTYDDVMTTARAGREVYCVITDAFGNTVTTDIATLIRIPKYALQINTQPTDNYVEMGQNYIVRVHAQGEGLSYQWYFRNEGSSTWYKSSVTSSIYKNTMTPARANREVYCVITDALGNTVKTNIAKLVLIPSADGHISKENAEILITACDKLLAKLAQDPVLNCLLEADRTRLRTDRDRLAVEVNYVFIETEWNDGSFTQKTLKQVYEETLTHYSALKKLLGY